MGMFDSLLIKINDKSIELQTKHFDCVLNNYSLGDVVSGASAGLSIFFDKVYLDAEGKMIYVDSDEVLERYTVFVILVNGVFTEFVVENNDWQYEAIEGRIDELRKVWSDTALVMSRWLDSIINKQLKIQSLNSKIQGVKSVIHLARKLENGEEISKWESIPHSETIKQLEQGDPAVDVIEAMLDWETRGVSGFLSDHLVVDYSLKNYQL